MSSETWHSDRQLGLHGTGIRFQCCHSSLAPRQLLKRIGTLCALWTNMNEQALCHCSPHILVIFHDSMTFSEMGTIYSVKVGGFGWCPFLESS